MPQRRPLSKTLVNGSACYELSSDTKSKLYNRALAGQSTSEVEAEEYVLKSIINHLLQRIEQHNTIANLPWTDRSRIHNNQDKRQVICQVRLSPKITYEDLWRSTGPKFSNKLLRSILQDYSIINWGSKQWAALTEAIASLRLAFAQAWELDSITKQGRPKAALMRGAAKGVGTNTS